MNELRIKLAKWILGVKGEHNCFYSKTNDSYVFHLRVFTSSTWSNTPREVKRG